MCISKILGMFKLIKLKAVYQNYHKLHVTIADIAHQLQAFGLKLTMNNLT